MKIICFLTFVFCFIYLGFVVLNLLMKKRAGANKEELSEHLKKEIKDNGILLFVAIVALMMNFAM